MKLFLSILLALSSLASIAMNIQTVLSKNVEASNEFVRKIKPICDLYALNYFDGQANFNREIKENPSFYDDAQRFYDSFKTHTHKPVMVSQVGFMLNDCIKPATPLKPTTAKGLFSNAMSQWTSNPKEAAALLIESDKQGYKYAGKKLSTIRNSSKYKKFEVNDNKIDDKTCIEHFLKKLDVENYLKKMNENLLKTRDKNFDYFAGETHIVARYQGDELEILSPPIVEIVPELTNADDAGEGAQEIVDDSAVPFEENLPPKSGENSQTVKTHNLEAIRKENGSNAKSIAHRRKILAHERKNSKSSVKPKKDIANSANQETYQTKSESISRKPTHAGQILHEETSEAESVLSETEHDEADLFKQEGRRDTNLSKLKKLLSARDLVTPADFKMTRTVVVHCFRELSAEPNRKISWNFERPKGDRSKLTATHIHDPSISITIHLHARKSKGKWYNDKNIRQNFLDFVASCDDDIKNILEDFKKDKRVLQEF